MLKQDLLYFFFALRVEVTTSTLLSRRLRYFSRILIFRTRRDIVDYTIAQVYPRFTMAKTNYVPSGGEMSQAVAATLKQVI
jgi:hypothetical protein